MRHYGATAQRRLFSGQELRQAESAIYFAANEAVQVLAPNPPLARSGLLQFAMRKQASVLDFDAAVLHHHEPS